MNEKLRAFIRDYVIGDALTSTLSRQDRLNFLLQGMVAGVLLSVLAGMLGM